MTMMMRSEKYLALISAGTTAINVPELRGSIALSRFPTPR
jgi:hypothetical protein